MQRWIFADFKALSRDDVRHIERGLYTDVVLGCSNGDKPWGWKHGKRDPWVKSVRMAQDAGLRVHLMPWVRRDERHLRACLEGVVGLHDDTGCDSILLDAEYHWIHVKKIPMREAAQLCRDLVGDRQLGVTSYTKTAEAIEELLAVCDYGCPQAYAFWRPGERDHWSHHKGSEPGRPQARAYRHWGDKPVVMALAAYWLGRPPRYIDGELVPAMSQREAWVRSLDAALDVPDGVDLVGLADWSLKWLHRWAGATERMTLARATSELVLAGRRGEILGQPTTRGVS